MMVKETRIIFAPTDVKQMRVVCSGCKGEIVRPLSASNFKLPQSCPHCNYDWWDKTRDDDPIIKHTKQLLDAMHYLLKAPEAEGTPFTARFEIDGEKSE